MRTPITYYGGKQQLSELIISMMSPHRIYCEPFFGGGAVFFAKPKSYLEVINDKNDKLITFYKEAQRNFTELAARINMTLHSESEYLKAKEIYKSKTASEEVEMAWAIWVLTNGSFSSSMHGGWKWCNGTAGSHTGVFFKNKRLEFNAALNKRLESVQISCRDAIDVIKQRDTSDSFFYLDPPYPGSVQGHYKGYTHNDLYNLLEVLQNIKGKFILSNYWCQTLRYFIAKNSWNVTVIDMPIRVANLTKAKRKNEVLISNYQNAPTLF